MKPHDLWRLYRAVHARRWLLLTIVFGTLLIVGTVSTFLPRYYRASAYVMPSELALSRPVLSGTESGLTGGGGAVTSPQRMEEQLATLLGLARTGIVRDKAIKSLGLGVSSSDLDELVQADAGTGAMIRISALSRTPQGAVSLTNALAHEFASYYQDLASRQARRNREFIEGALTDATFKLAAAKQGLQDLKAHKGEAALPTGTAENPFLNQFYQLRAQVDATRSSLKEVEGRLAASKRELAKQPARRETQTETSQNPRLDSLRDEQARLERELLLAQARYTEKSPKVIDLRTQIDDVKQRIARETGQLVSQRLIAPNPVYAKLRDQMVDLAQEREALSSRLGSLTQAMAENERRAGDLADTSVVLAAKGAEFEGLQARYDQLKQMLEAARLEERVSAGREDIAVVDEAKSATGPVMRSGPSVGQLLLLGVALSLVLGFGSVLALAFLDTRVKSRADLVRELALPVPAVIPTLNGHAPGTALPRITGLQPLSPHAEAYRFLSAQLAYRNGAPALRTLLIVTARPGQGGSTTAANVALCLAELGRRVVLVDADLRRPCLHDFFGESVEPGLTDLLSNGGEQASALRTTAAPNLLLLPAGPPVPNPVELLASDRMRQVLAQLRAHTDCVVLDAPAASVFADAAILGPLVDGVIMVTRANQPLQEADHDTKELLEAVGATIVGAVLNDAAAASPSGYERPPTRPQTLLPPPSESGATGATSATAEAMPPAAAEPPQVASRPSGGPGVPAVTKLRRAPRRLALAALGVALVGIAGYALLGARPHSSSGTPAGRRVAGAKSASFTVTATILQPTKVRVERDGRLLYTGPLTNGQQVWQAEREIRIWADRPEAIEVSVNGKPTGALGKAGDPPGTRRFTAQDGAPAPQ